MKRGCLFLLLGKVLCCGWLVAAPGNETDTRLSSPGGGGSGAGDGVPSGDAGKQSAEDATGKAVPPPAPLLSMTENDKAMYESARKMDAQQWTALVRQQKDAERHVVKGKAFFRRKSGDDFLLDVPLRGTSAPGCQSYCSALISRRPTPADKMIRVAGDSSSGTACGGCKRGAESASGEQEAGQAASSDREASQASARSMGKRCRRFMLNNEKGGARYLSKDNSQAAVYDFLRGALFLYGAVDVLPYNQQFIFFDDQRKTAHYAYCPYTGEVTLVAAGPRVNADFVDAEDVYEGASGAKPNGAFNSVVVPVLGNFMGRYDSLDEAARQLTGQSVTAEDERTACIRVGRITVVPSEVVTLVDELLSFLSFRKRREKFEVPSKLQETVEVMTREDVPRIIMEELRRSHRLTPSDEEEVANRLEKINGAYNNFPGEKKRAVIELLHSFSRDRTEWKLLVAYRQERFNPGIFGDGRRRIHCKKVFSETVYAGTVLRDITDVAGEIVKGQMPSGAVPYGGDEVVDMSSLARVDSHPQTTVLLVNERPLPMNGLETYYDPLFHRQFWLGCGWERAKQLSRLDDADAGRLSISALPINKLQNFDGAVDTYLEGCDDVALLKDDPTEQTSLGTGLVFTEKGGKRRHVHFTDDNTSNPSLADFPASTKDALIAFAQQIKGRLTNVYRTSTEDSGDVFLFAMSPCDDAVPEMYYGPSSAPLRTKSASKDATTRKRARRDGHETHPSSSPQPKRQKPSLPPPPTAFLETASKREVASLPPLVANEEASLEPPQAAAVTPFAPRSLSILQKSRWCQGGACLVVAGMALMLISAVAVVMAKGMMRNGNNRSPSDDEAAADNPQAQYERSLTVAPDKVPSA